jgi:hypothetical protein
MIGLLNRIREKYLLDLKMMDNGLVIA